MARVICTLPNASDEISGVKFTKHEHGMQSEDIPLAQAEAFIEITGYKLVGEAPAKEKAAVQAPAALPDDNKTKADAQAEVERLAGQQAEEQRLAAEQEARELAALAEELKSLGVEVKGNWKAPRLKAELKRAKEEKAAADAAAPAAKGDGATGDQGKAD